MNGTNEQFIEECKAQGVALKLILLDARKDPEVAVVQLLEKFATQIRNRNWKRDSANSFKISFKRPQGVTEEHLKYLGQHIFEHMGIVQYTCKLVQIDDPRDPIDEVNVTLTLE